MENVETIKNLQALDYSKYAAVSSREKLVAYTIKYLNDIDVPTNFNNVCIASFKLFPEKFYFSEEFKEYPHIEMLNRTLLHLRPKERDYATGSSRIDYVLTSLGKEIAKQVEQEITRGEHSQTVEKKKMDSYKKTDSNDYNKIICSREYNGYLENEIVNINMIWIYYQVTPFTQLEKIKKDLSNIKKYAKEIEDVKCIEYIDKLLLLIK